MSVEAYPSISGRLKQGRTPSGGSDRTQCAERGGVAAAPGRPKQGRTPSGGSDRTQCAERGG